MRDIAISDLASLVLADVPEVDSRIQEMFNWYFSRNMAITKWVLGAAASLTISGLIALFKAEIKPNLWQSIILVALPILTSIYGFYRLSKIRRIHTEFVAALRIYNDLRQIRRFLVKYNKSIK
jgi:hypothetical protein